ncbi:myb family transcription factor EFM-like [Gossypium arboreum]|uniref:HTH myb-type domain-containing protein n=1 Tax=Gossypium arboreum TaxID=29729 RepID=A0ABR0P7C7_GOSAR|nr:myb family transcription factor EFM-like [Gossypium arboreum]KAK5817119.1 hypothetical protein PVK06_022042 [Gossypium arboreum]
MASSSSSELTLDCKPHGHFAAPSKCYADQQQIVVVNHTLKLEDYLSRLEEERLKIDAFKRELPLCMQLLTNALESSRQQLQAYRANQGPKPVLEEFMPLKTSVSENIDKSQTISDHKANWMTTAQLWSQAGHYETKQQSSSITTSSPKDTDIGLNVVSPKLGSSLDSKQRIGGAFLPFSKDRNSCSSALPDLSLASSDTENGTSCQQRGDGTSNNRTDGQTTNGSNTNQPHRKARRCWSPDLHRRFVNALQMLGGSQVATPKQIRELMKVDGLTNDEVKSHLQKYRLHTRRPSPIPQAAGAPTPQLVVLGGIWVPPEYATAAHSGGPAMYGAHHHHHPAVPHAPPHFCASPVPQEFYTTAATPALPPPHHTFHHQLHNMYNARNSPEPDVREAGDRSESIEDGKSESGSWKGESCGDQRIGLAALREEGEESNRSEITLKF